MAPVSKSRSSEAFVFAPDETLISAGVDRSRFAAFFVLAVFFPVACWAIHASAKLCNSNAR